ncbi:MAG: DUF4093 domain-containing protein [Clostridia bacterium]|nr:DUF4093 domain-containing protein [Clostridia bacterium]MBO5299312.1 DUF4093 domain-containing protein [Clostridia bacterium]MBQ4629220.1 DUF4093 domain-containing protein [Clostridia bacterium]
MIKINEIIVVEGKYDSAAVRRHIDTLVLETGGFRLFKDPELLDTIKLLAEKRGVVILTDSDSAGFLIRNKILSFVDKKYVKNAYIPDIKGVERRKREPSKEGFLGVEGMTGEVIIDALRKAGVDLGEGNVKRKTLKKSDLYEMGLSGRPDSAKKRLELQKSLGLPKYLSANKLMEILCNL